MKTYCSKCGHPNPYAAKKPKFCNECGESFAISTSNSVSAPPRKKEPIVIEEEEGLSEVIERVPDIHGLDVEIESGKIVGATLGEVVDAAANGPIDAPITPKSGKRSRKISKKARGQMDQQVLDDWKKESGAIRRKERSD